MGLLGKLFGGGTDLAIALNSSNVIAGGIVAGKVTVTGGKKPLTITSLVVRVVYVHVSTTGDSPMPKIDLRQLAELTVVANAGLPAGASQGYDFTLQLPEGLDPTGSYKVLARADIPSVKDPSAEADFKVITPGGGKRGGILAALRGASEEDILGRYPDLLSDDEDDQLAALCELRGDAYGEDAPKLVGIAPWLLRFVKTGPEDLRDEALETWALILNNRSRPSDIAELEALAGTDMTTDLRDAFITAVTKFADEGAAPLLARLAADRDPEVRAQVAYALRSEADDDLPGRFDLVNTLTTDSDIAVRRAAAGALSAFSDDATAMRRAAELAGTDPAPEVRAEALEALGSAHYYGMLDLAVGTFQAHVASPAVEVRRAIAGELASLPPDPRVGPLVRALLADRSAEVRKRMAWAGVNMGDHPELAPLFRAVAENDADDDVRAEAVSGMRGFLESAAAIAYARARFAADGTEPMAWAALSTATYFDEDPTAKALLQELARCQYSSVVSSARDSLNG